MGLPEQTNDHSLPIYGLPDSDDRELSKAIHTKKIHKSHSSAFTRHKKVSQNQASITTSQIKGPYTFPKLVIISNPNQHSERAKSETRKKETGNIGVAVNHQRISEDSLGGLLLHLLILRHKLLIVLLVVLLGGQVLSSLGVVDLLLAGAGTTDHIAGVDLL